MPPPCPGYSTRASNFLKSSQILRKNREFQDHPSHVFYFLAHVQRLGHDAATSCEENQDKATSTPDRQGSIPVLFYLLEPVSGSRFPTRGCGVQSANRDRGSKIQECPGLKRSNLLEGGHQREQCSTLPCGLDMPVNEVEFPTGSGREKPETIRSRPKRSAPACRPAFSRRRHGH